MNADTARQILLLARSQRISRVELARQFGISVATLKRLVTGQSHANLAPEVPRLRFGQWVRLSDLAAQLPPEMLGHAAPRRVAASYLDAVGVPEGGSGWAALTPCGRVVTVVSGWERVPQLKERWEVVNRSRQQLLGLEPICETCRFRGRCRQADEGEVPAAAA